MRPASAPLLLALAACVPPALQAPAPASLHSTRAVAAVVQSASQTLTAAGFEIRTVDAKSGVLTARRFQTKTGNAEYLTCDFARGSLREQHLNSTLTVSVNATPAPDGSAVTIGARALSQYPGLEDTPLAVPDSDTDCVSNGTIEARLSGALR